MRLPGLGPGTKEVAPTPFTTSLFFDLPAAIPPPDETDRPYQEIRGGQHIQDAQIQTFALRTAIFEIALGCNAAHGTLSLYLDD